MFTWVKGPKPDPENMFTSSKSTKPDRKIEHLEEMLATQNNNVTGLRIAVRRQNRSLQEQSREINRLRRVLARHGITDTVRPKRTERAPTGGDSKK